MWISYGSGLAAGPGTYPRVTHAKAPSPQATRRTSNVGRAKRPGAAEQGEDAGDVGLGLGDRAGCSGRLRRRRGRRCSRRWASSGEPSWWIRSDIRWAWASIAATGVEGVVEPVGGRQVPGMNWAMPWAPAGDNGEGVEVRLRHQLRRQQRGGDVPVRSGVGQGRPEAGRDECRQGRAGSGALSHPHPPISPSPRLRARWRTSVEAIVPGLPGVPLTDNRSGWHWPASQE